MRAWFLNLGPPSLVSPKEANADIEAIWSTDPALLVGCEAIAKGPLPGPGSGNLKVRDSSTNGRANLFAYVKGVTKDKFWWTWEDCASEFPRNKYPGQHPPRSILRFRFQGSQVVVAHKPPAWDGAAKARAEHDRRLARIMDPSTDSRQSRLLFWDSNGLEGAQALADQIAGKVVGTHIDNAVVRRVKVIEFAYKKGVNGHQFHTDHPWGAFYLRWKPFEEEDGA